MADKELNIKVNTETDNSSLTELKDMLIEIKDILTDVGSDASFESVGTEAENASTSVEGLDDSLNSTSAGLDEIGSSADGASEGLDNLADSADGAGESLDGMSESGDNFSQSMGVMEGSMLLQASEQVRQIGSSAEDMAQGLDTAQISIGQLATKTGMAESEMSNLIQYISNVTFPREEAIAYVNALNQMGVSADKLGDSATNMDRINDATHMGYSNVISLTQGLRSMGVEADNLPSSFNALAYAESNITNGASVMGTVLKRQSPVINEYGLNVDQVAVMMGKLSESGVQNMKLGTEMSKILKDNNGDLSAVEKQLGLTAGALTNASEETGKYNGKLVELANQEMEHKTITERLADVWSDLSLQLAPVINPLGSVIGLLGQVGSFAMGVNGILTLAETFGILNLETLALIPSQIAEGIAGWFAIGWIAWAVVAIVALIAILGYLYFTNEDVRKAIDGLGQAFMWFAQIAIQAITDAVNYVISNLQNLWNYIVTLGGLLPANVQITGNNIIDTVLRVMAFIATLPIQLQIIFVNMIAKTLGFGDNFVQRMYTTAVNSVTRFISQIASLPSKLATELNNMLSAVNTWASTLPQRFWDAGVNAVRNFLSALGIASPGTMQRMLVWEITEMGRRVPLESEKLLSNVGALGKDIVGEFGNPTLKIGYDTLIGEFGNASLSLPINQTSAKNNEDEVGDVYNININIENVDRKERVDEIVDAVTQALAWTNTTAGRSV